MKTKALIIRQNDLFFKEHFYNWLAKERGLYELYNRLAKEYKKEKSKGPLLLEDTFKLVAGGLTKKEFEEYCKNFFKKFYIKETEKVLKKIENKYEIFISTSFPEKLFEFFKFKKIIVGVREKLREGKIIGFNNLKIKNKEKVKRKLEEIDLYNTFTLEPNRYGCLIKIIDYLINNWPQEVIGIGKSPTAQPIKKITTKWINNLEELV